MKMDNKISIRIKRLRKEHGYKSQEKFADALHVHPKTVQGWESTENPKLPDLDNLLMICEILDCDLDYLVGRIEQRKHNIKTVSEITGLSEKAVEIITKTKPYRDLSDLSENDYCEENGKLKLTKAGVEKVKQKKKHFSIMVTMLSRIIESDRFPGLIMAYKNFLDSASKLKESALEPPEYGLNDKDTVVLSRDEATRYYMRRVADEMMFICEEEYQKQFSSAMNNRKEKDKQLEENELQPEGGQEDDDD